MLKFEIISPELKKSRELSAIEKSYIERAARFAKLVITETKAVKLKSPKVEDHKQKEGQLLLSQTKSQACIISLNENGKNLSSVEFANLISENSNSGLSHFQFLIGGPYGLSQEVIDKSKYNISLSKMTFTARIATFLLIEQLYRATQIINGHPYHKA